MPYITSIREVKAEEVEKDFVKDTKIQWLITKDQGAPHFAMRRFVVRPGGEIGLHNHPAEHEVYVISGKGAVLFEGGESSVGPGNAIFVPGDEQHGFRNVSDSEDFVFICMIPNPGD